MGTERITKIDEISIPETISPTEVDKLIVMAGSIDSETRQKALGELVIKWDKLPLIDSEPREVSLESVFEPYHEGQRESILRNCVGFQLTQGCNNFCPFCLYRKKGDPLERGITAKFVIEDFGPFFEKYGSHLSESAVPWHFSDPLDADIVGFIEAYDSVDISSDDSYNQKSPFEITTAVAAGKEQELVKLIKFLNERDPKLRQTVINLSYNEANAKRIDFALALATQSLLEEGRTKDEIADYFANTIRRRDSRVKNAVNQGRMIGGKEGITDVHTVACQDGVVITPEGVVGVITVAATPYNPAGEIQYPIDSNNFQIPKIKESYGYIKFFTDSEIPFRIPNYRGLIQAGSEYYPDLEVVFKDPNRTDIMHIGRDVLAINTALQVISILDQQPREPRLEFNTGFVPREKDLHDYWSKDSMEWMRELINKGLNKRYDAIKARIDSLKERNPDLDYMGLANEIEYYVTLGETFKTIVEIILPTVDSSDDMEEWASVAKNVKKVVEM